MTQWIGLDIGTSSVKAIALDDTGEVVGRGTADYSESAPSESHEQCATDYLLAVHDALAECNTDGTTGIGVVGQTPTLVLVDETGAPVRPAITWRDSRALAEADELSEVLPSSLDMFGVDNLLDRSQLPAKLLWLARHEPHSLDKARWILQPKDFIGLALTGVATSDPWSSKGLCSVMTRKPEAALFSLAGASCSLVPTIRDPWTQLGLTTPQAATKLGVPERVPVAVGWTDALGGMLGIGAVTHPLTFALTGTSDIVGTSKERPGQAIEGLYQVPQSCSPLTIDYGPTQSSGASLTWLSRLTGRTVNELVAAAADAAPTNALFLPYLRGERAPIWNPRVSASLSALHESDGIAEVALAVMRGVALSGQHIMETSWGACDTAAEIHLGGANVNQPGWLRTRREVHTKRLLVHQEPQLPALGAAMLARSAASGCELSEAFASLHSEILVVPQDEHRDLAFAETLYSRYEREVDRALNETLL